MKYDISKYIVPNNQEVLKIKSLLDREEEYGYILAPIEYSIGQYFLMDRRLTDKELTNLLKNILENYLSPDKIHHPLEKTILINLSEELKHNKTTKHEFELGIRYIIWVISNRAWLNDKQAYLKWITYAMGFFSGKESEEYAKKVTKYARRHGVPQKHIDTMILRKNDDFPDNIKGDFVKETSELFSMDDKNKFDYVLNNFLKEPRLLETYLDYLYESKDEENEEAIYKAILEKYEMFLPVEIMLGMFYARKKNYQLAEFHLIKFLKDIDALDSFPQKEETKKEVQKELSKIRKFL